MKKQIAVLFLASLIACKKDKNDPEESTTPTQSKSWKTVSHDSTRHIIRVLFHGNNYGYFISDENYLLRTKDGGNSFSVLPLPVNYMLLGATLIDSTGLILTYNYNTFKTTNGAETWTAIETSSLSTALFDGWFLNSNLGYVGGVNCILKTIDGGNTWQKLEIANDSFRNIKFTSANIGWADNGFGVVYRTADGGNTWTAHPTGFTSNAYTYFLNDQTAFVLQSSVMSLGVALKRTTDGGTTWETVYADGNAVPWTCFAFQDQEKGFASVNGGLIYHSANGGAAWSHQKVNTNNRSVYQIEVLPNGNLWAAGRNGLIMKYE